jgi:hypothetical protein
MTLADEGREWRDWYALARQDIQLVCSDQGWCLDRFIDVLAITSPRISVRRNIRVALQYMRTGEWLSAVIRGTRQAMAHYELTGEIRGPKTRPFAAALRGDETNIVLDTWMATAFEIDQSTLSRKGIRVECEKRIKRTARRYGWSNAATQAAIWAATVRRAGRRVPALRVSDELSLWDIGD